MASSLAQEVLDNAFVDLNPAGFRDGGTNLSAATKPLTHVFQSTSHRKRKQGNTPVAPENGLAEISLNVGAQMNDTPKLISLRIAALEAVEFLVTVVRMSLAYIYIINTYVLILRIVTDSSRDSSFVWSCFIFVVLV